MSSSQLERHSDFLLLEFMLLYELFLVIFLLLPVNCLLASLRQTAETTNPWEELQIPCHHAQLSRSSELVKMFVPAPSPHTSIKFLCIVVDSPLVIFNLSSKVLLTSLSFSLALFFSAG